MTPPRLFVEAPLEANATIALDEARSRYLHAVLRLGPGAPVRLFNGRDGEWAAVLGQSSKRGGELQVTERTRAQIAAPDLWLLFAPLKRHATDLVAEKATELGVRKLQPAVTRRTVAETVRVDRLRAIAIEAAEQSERLDVPSIEEAAPLHRLLQSWSPDRPLIYADEAGDDPTEIWGGVAGRAPPIAQALAAVEAAQIALLIGPEGGFDPEERRMLRALPYVVPVSLGPRILRAETAAIAALVMVQSCWGDWRER